MPFTQFRNNTENPSCSCIGMILVYANLTRTIEKILPNIMGELSVLENFSRKTSFKKNQCYQI